ncbi:MAG: hypothetical protein HY722_09205 [Planctomycetes bacterium]|nr:hypothetical protein [Planctomycetota bacterium]
MKSSLQSLAMIAVTSGLVYFLLPHLQYRGGKDVHGSSGSSARKVSSIMHFPNAEGVALTCLTEVVRAGEDIEVGWKGLDDHGKDDWVGIFPPDDLDNAYLDYVQTGGGSGGTVKIPIPANAPPGEYQVRFYSKASWYLIATLAIRIQARR